MSDRIGPRRKFIYLALALFIGGLVFLVLGALDRSLLGVKAKRKTDIRIIAASEEVVSLGLSSASWVDEGNIAFSGKLEGGEVGLYLWKIGDRPQLYRRFGKSSKARYLCAENGVLNYSPDVEPGPGPVTVFRGRPGFEFEKPLRPPVNDRNFEYGIQVNQTTFGSVSITGRRCDIFVDDNKSGRSWVANYNNDAYLDFGKLWSYSSVSFELPGGGDKIALPISISDVYPQGVETPSWDGSFFTWPKTSLSGSGRSRAKVSGYRIFRTGRFEKISVENSPALWGGEFFPYRDGYIVATLDGGMRGIGGIYLLENGKLKKKFDGNFIAISMSPSGCRLAVAILDTDAAERAHLKIIQLCDGGRHD
ncbi:hypothetical protein [Caulobacter sp. AP07]|uniref:hypothetical protein n=1 Tax=Caulobacter sp. AP07 TaxID=1144304 RepID=UPI0003022094|nr:hypothetical protein [Caulobacter sp. AP07]